MFSALPGMCCSDLARTAETFARENMELKEEVGRLRDDKEDSSRAKTAMQVWNELH